MFTVEHFIDIHINFSACFLYLIIKEKDID